MTIVLEMRIALCMSPPPEHEILTRDNPMEHIDDFYGYDDDDSFSVPKGEAQAPQRYSIPQYG